MKFMDVEIERLDCIDLYGLSLGFNGRRDRLTDKLLAYQNSSSAPNHGMGRIELRINPLDSSRFLMLEGHHRSFSAHVYGEKISSIIYDNVEEIRSSLPRENFERGLSYNQTASLLGIGTVQELMDESTFKEYLEHLQRLKNRNGDIHNVIAALEKFWRTKNTI